MNPLNIALCLVWLCGVGCPPAPALSPEEPGEAEVADLRLEVQQLKEEVEDIKEDIEVVKLKEDVRDITEDIEDIKEEIQEFREDSKHDHVNPYRFFNKIEKGVEKPRKEEVEEEDADKINPLKLRKIVKFCGSSEISNEAQRLCSELAVLQVRLSGVIEKGSQSDDEEIRTENENEGSGEKLSRSKRDV